MHTLLKTDILLETCHHRFCLFDPQFVLSLQMFFVTVFSISRRKPISDFFYIHITKGS